MTWTGWPTVTEVDEEAKTVTLRASAEAKVKPWPGQDTEVPELYANTEGDLRAVEIVMTFADDVLPLAVGDRVSVNGHFSKTPV